MLTQIIGGVRVEYKAVRFVDEFDGEQNGKTLKELLAILTPKDAGKRSDYKDLLENWYFYNFSTNLSDFNSRWR